MAFQELSEGVAGRRRIAVIGSGIAGLSAAWMLGRTMEVVLYEADRRPGGHANTVTVREAGAELGVDTGFIVYNDRNYPNLVALFEHLDVPNQASDMSFAASLDGGRFEYSGSSISGMIGQHANVVRPRFWRMLSDILRFYKEAPLMLARPDLATVSLGDFLDDSRYGPSFIDDHLLPMGAAIWSTTAREMRDYPLHAFIRFFASHGLLSLKDRPQWRTVTGGSREYVSRILADFSGTVRCGARIASVRREPGAVTVIDEHGHRDTFTDVVIAAHADQTLSMLDDADEQERSLLGAFSYTPNVAVLHRDEALMPRRRKVWSSWNYVADARAGKDRPLCVTYWMNRLQSIDPASPYFVTLNPCRGIRPDRMIASFDYTHPLFDHGALAAQPQLWQLQGRRNTWFCGAYFGSGFHEDGLQSGLAVAEAMGAPSRPWSVPAEADRVHLRQALMAAE